MIDTDPATKNPHVIAARIIADIKKTGRAVTHEDINSVLKEQGHSITAYELKQLININHSTYKVADLINDTKDLTIYKAFNILYPNKVTVGTRR